MPEVDTGDVEALTAGDVETVVPIVIVLAKSYTRGQGFTNSERGHRRGDRHRLRTVGCQR